MSREINFVQARRKQLTKHQQSDLKIFKITSITFGVLIAIFLVVLSTDLFLQFRVKSLMNQEKQIESQILGHGLVEQSILITTEKLKLLTDFFNQRYDKQAAIEYFSQIFGPEVMINDINYEADENILSLRIRSSSVFILEQVFAQLANPEVAARFGSISRSALTRDDRGKYSMTITLTLSENTEIPK